MGRQVCVQLNVFIKAVHTATSVAGCRQVTRRCAAPSAKLSACSAGKAEDAPAAPQPAGSPVKAEPAPKSPARADVSAKKESGGGRGSKTSGGAEASGGGGGRGSGAGKSSGKVRQAAGTAKSYSSSAVSDSSSHAKVGCRT